MLCAPFLHLQRTGCQQKAGHKLFTGAIVLEGLVLLTVVKISKSIYITHVWQIILLLSTCGCSFREDWKDQHAVFTLCFDCHVYIRFFFRYKNFSHDLVSKRFFLLQIRGYLSLILWLSLASLKDISTKQPNLSIQDVISPMVTTTLHSK